MTTDGGGGLARLAMAHEMSRRALLGRMAMLAGAVALPSALVAACGTDDSQTSNNGDSGKPLEITLMRIGISANQRSMDIANNFYSSAWGPKLHSVESPLRFKPDGSVEPALASSFDKPNDKTFVLHIRQGVKFHDGSELTAEDVRYSLQRNITQKTAAGTQHYGNVSSIAITGTNEVTITLSKVDPLFEKVLAYPATFVESKAYMEMAGAQFGTPQYPGMGTGPMKVDTFSLSNGYILTRHADYWGDSLHIDRIEATPITDAGARLLALRSGSIDMAENVPVDSYATWADAGTIISLPDFFWFGWSFTMDEPPFDDIHVRRAIAYATDSESILHVASPSAKGSRGITPPSFWTSMVSQDKIDTFYKTLPQYAFSMDAAKRELAQSKVPQGFSTTVWVSNQYPQMEAMASNTAQNLKPLGIDIKIEERPTEQILPRWLGLDQFKEHRGLGLMPMIHGAVMPEGSAYTFGIASTAAIGSGTFNSARYSNSQVDALFQTAATTTNNDERWNAYSQIMTIVQQDLPFHSVFHDGPLSAMRKEWQIVSSAQTPWRTLRQWYRDIRQP